MQELNYSAEPLNQNFSEKLAINVLKYAPVNLFIPRVVTVKCLRKNYKLDSRLKNKTWTNPQSKNNEKSYEFRLIRQNTGYRNPERVYLRFLSTLI
jgi:hypothetical protein